MKIVTAFLKYDYGIKERGISVEEAIILPAIKQVNEDVIPFWLEDNGFPNDIKGLQTNLLDFVNKKKADLIFFILMKDEIKVETIRELNKTFKTVNWFCDDQWRFDDFSSKIGPELSYVITVDKFSVEKYHSIGCNNVFLTQWATAFYQENLDLDKVNYKYDVSFIGGKNLIREWYIYELGKRGIEVACFGSGWTGGRLPLDDMNQIFLESKINLNLSNSLPRDIRYYRFINKQLFLIPFSSLKLRKKAGLILRIILTLLGRIEKKNVEQIKARNFEIAGAGGFELSQYALEVEDYYVIGKEIAIFSTLDELVLQIHYYLNNSKLRKKIAKEGYLKSAQYTYKDKMEKIIQGIKQ